MSSGAVVIHVEPGSSAEEAKLRPGDVILEVDRKSIETVAAFRAAHAAAGERLLLLVNRRGATLFLTLPK